MTARSLLAFAVSTFLHPSPRAILPPCAESTKPSWSPSYTMPSRQRLQLPRRGCGPSWRGKVTGRMRLWPSTLLPACLAHRWLWSWLIWSIMAILDSDPGYGGRTRRGRTCAISHPSRELCHALTRAGNAPWTIGTVRARSRVSAPTRILRHSRACARSGPQIRFRPVILTAKRPDYRIKDELALASHGAVCIELCHAPLPSFSAGSRTCCARLYGQVVAC